MSISRELHARIGETEYATFDPRHTEPGRYGTYYFHPDFPDRYDANQLFRVACDAENAERMLAELTERSTERELDYSKLSGYDPRVFDHLAPRLERAGWSVWNSPLLLLSEEASRTSNRALEISPVDASSPDLEGLYSSDGVVDRGFQLARNQYRRLGGEYLVGYLDSRPACCTGWYVVNRMARFRHVYTAPWARGLGCATTLILHVQRHPEVRAQDGLAIMVNSDGPVQLYQSLGFRFVMDFWEARISRSDGA